MNPHELPEELGYAWVMWMECFTGNPLTYAELHSWSALSGNELAPWEVEILMAIDRTYWSIRNHD